MYDIAIAGAGPAGATLARLLSDHYHVLLLDRRRLNTPPEEGRPGKPCGGLIAPDAQKALASLGLGLPDLVLSDPQVFAVRAIDVSIGLERTYQRHYVNVDRERFDRWLLSLLPTDVEFRGGCRLRDFAVLADHVALAVADDRGTSTARARILVGADGAGSLVRRLVGERFPRFGKPPRCRRYVAIQEWFEAENPPPHYAAVFDPSITDFYSWVVPKTGRLLVGSALPADASAKGRFERLKGRLSRHGFDLSRPVFREATPLNRPAHPGQVWLGTGRVALVGEAAGWISPSSAEGISYALRSATLLAEALREGGGGFLRRYRLAARRLRLNVLLKNAKGLFICRPALRRLAMRLTPGGITPLKPMPAGGTFPRSFATRPGGIALR